jgi:hypothetical protein
MRTGDPKALDKDGRPLRNSGFPVQNSGFKITRDIKGGKVTTVKTAEKVTVQLFDDKGKEVVREVDSAAGTTDPKSGLEKTTP